MLSPAGTKGSKTELTLPDGKTDDWTMEWCEDGKEQHTGGSEGTEEREWTRQSCQENLH